MRRRSVFKGIELFSYGRCLYIVWRVWLFMGQSLKIFIALVASLMVLIILPLLHVSKIRGLAHIYSCLCDLILSFSFIA